MIARDRVIRFSSTARLRRVVGIVRVLVIAIDDRSIPAIAKARLEVHCYAKIVVEIAVASTGDSALTDATVVNYWGGRHLCEATAGSRTEVLCHIYVPGRTHWVTIRWVSAVIVGGAIIHDINVPSLVSNTPREDGCVSLSAVHLNR